jgi:HSP20 family molecular chaperone IbpA
LRYGTFARSFAIPVDVRPEAVRASYDAGILEIRIDVGSDHPAPDRLHVDHPESSGS